MASGQPRRSTSQNRLTTTLLEAKALARCVRPMPTDSAVSLLAKVSAFMLVSAWALVIVGLSFEMIETTVPPYFLAFTALVFLLVGKLWDIEAAKLLPGTTGSGSESGRDTDASAEDD